MNTGTIGAIHELHVAEDLMRQGYHVFRALSPASPCDLMVITPDGRLLRVEVTTARYQASGKLTFTPHDETKYDLIVGYVKETGAYVYHPPLETTP